MLIMFLHTFSILQDKDDDIKEELYKEITKLRKECNDLYDEIDGYTGKKESIKLEDSNVWEQK